MIDDQSFDHLGIAIVDLSKIKHEVFTTKINYMDEKFVSKYLKDSDNDVNNKITAFLMDPVQKNYWEKRKRFYIFFLATETDLPNHFLEFYVGKEIKETDESIMARTSSIKETNVEGGLCGLNSYIQQASLSTQNLTSVTDMDNKESLT